VNRCDGFLCEKEAAHVVDERGELTKLCDPCWDAYFFRQGMITKLVHDNVDVAISADSWAFYDLFRYGFKGFDNYTDGELEAELHDSAKGDEGWVNHEVGRTTS